MSSQQIAILGSGNIGLALAKGIVKAGLYSPGQIILTRRNLEKLTVEKNAGFNITNDNASAVRKAEIVVIAVLPQHIDRLLKDIKADIRAEKHLIVSVVTGVDSAVIQEKLGSDVEVTRAMPNTAIAIGKSMTCFTADHLSANNILLIQKVFNTVGYTMPVSEELMSAATALCACGIAFFMRTIRAAAQGGTEIGFHAHEALSLAAKTALGAASLLVELESHPETEIDKVTSPKGCTISGLNEMEHSGFSSAMIKGIKTSAVKANELYY